MYSQYSNVSAYSEFWQHEYTKHLVCAVDFMHALLPTPVAAFQETVALAASSDLAGVLAAAGIVPRQAAYTVGAMRTALANHFGVQPQLRCNGPQQAWLSTALLCFDTHLKAINCPALSAESFTALVPGGDVPCGPDSTAVLLPRP